MVTFVVILIVIWIASFMAWWFMSSAFKSVDSDKIKSRLLGESPLAKKGKSAKPVAPLIQKVDPKTGKLTLQLLSRYRLQERLQGLLEQAGLKWNVARLVHCCLAMFLLGFALAWFSLPAVYRQAFENALEPAAGRVHGEPAREREHAGRQAELGRLEEDVRAGRPDPQRGCGDPGQQAGDPLEEEVRGGRRRRFGRGC